MTTYLPIIKQWHIAFALLSLGGFVLRGMLMLYAPQRLQNRWLRRLPHVIDTLLFGLGITLLWFGPWSLWSAPWLQAKLSALLLYIGLGFIALHRGRFARRTRLAAWLAAITVFAYMLAAAHWKQAWV
ncbi:MAG TPA: SirB2 family protein [Gammaproteobacteria bacterium]|jgi:uncharacterized membrane protein SirB2